MERSNENRQPNRRHSRSQTRHNPQADQAAWAYPPHGRSPDDFHTGAGAEDYGSGEEMTTPEIKFAYDGGKRRFVLLLPMEREQAKNFVPIMSAGGVDVAANEHAYFEHDMSQVRIRISPPISDSQHAAIVELIEKQSGVIHADSVTGKEAMSETQRYTVCEDGGILDSGERMIDDWEDIARILNAVDRYVKAMRVVENNGDWDENKWEDRPSLDEIEEAMK